MKKTLADIRKEKNLSQGDLASKMDIAVSTYCQYETGKRNIPTHIVEKLCEILEIKQDDIFLPTRFTVSNQQDGGKR